MCSAPPDGANLPVVHWELVRGELARYQGLDTPVGRSPCGVCLDAGATILVSRPARAFAWLEDTRPSILEELIAPLQDGSGRVAGTLWIAHHDVRSHCSADDARILEQLASQIVLALRLQEAAKQREHAFADQRAGEITVRLHRTSEHVLVPRITDSGVGADLAQAAGGMGLTLMRTLATQLRGTLELEGHAGSKGTRVTLSIP